MIQVEEKNVCVKGNGVMVMTELSMIIHTLINELDIPKVLVDKAVEIGSKSDEEIAKETIKAERDFIEYLVKGVQ